LLKFIAVTKRRDYFIAIPSLSPYNIIEHPAYISVPCTYPVDEQVHTVHLTREQQALNSISAAKTPWSAACPD